MAYRDDVTQAVQQMATELRKMRDRVDEIIASPGDSVRPHVGDVLEQLTGLRLDMQRLLTSPWLKGQLGRMDRTGLVERIPSDVEKEQEARAAKAMGPAVASVDESTTVVKRRECNCGGPPGSWPSGLAFPASQHAKDCPVHPSQRERTLREVGATPDSVLQQDFNRAAPRPSDKHHLP